MLTAATSVIERRVTISDDFFTHPYEAGWASEAIFFVQVEGSHNGLVVQSQVSPDGINWVNRGETRVIETQENIIDITLQQFGSWVRLAITGASVDNTSTILVHLAMKG